MTAEDICNRINKQWENKSPKMDWTGLEQSILDVLRLAAKQKTSPQQALTMIDEFVGAYTRRGNVGLSNMGDDWRIF